MGGYTWSKRRLNEESCDGTTLEVAIAKSREGSPLTLEELKSLVNVDIVTLIVEYNLSYPEATTVVSWRKNEIFRFNAQDISYGGPTEPLIEESISRKLQRSPKRQRRFTGTQRRSLRSIIREEIDKIFKNNVK